MCPLGIDFSNDPLLQGRNFPLLQKAGVDPEADEGLIRFQDPKMIAGFIESCRKLRLWGREMAVKL